MMGCDAGRRRVGGTWVSQKERCVVKVATMSGWVLV